ncbi:MAG TPA: RNA methyltransferase [Firmicutes bacterium]|nr:RNA methyltransferase [Bacillota bacterium]
MEVITSLDNKKIKELSKLLYKKYREIEGKFLVEGEHLVNEALKTGNLIEVIKTVDYEVDFNAKTTFVTYEVIKKLCSSVTPQKVIGVVKKLEEREIGNKILILDNLQDPGNLGTIIRSSVAFNVDTIVLSENSVDLYNDKAIRSSEGMIFYANIIKRNIDEFIDELHSLDYQVLGTRVTDGLNVKEMVTSKKIAIVMGNEGAGVRKEILDKCDKFLYIPMSSNCESLNVGVATSIILYELF